MIKISVIVPVYNVEQYLDKCLSSLVNQTLEEIEIIVVNDGTQDDSQKIIDMYVKKYSNKVFSYIKQNGGLSSARNFGISKANGEYVAFVDSDDYVSFDMYEKLYTKAISNSFDMVCCDFFEIRSGKEIACTCNLNQDVFTKEAVKETMIAIYPSAWNKIYKLDLLKQSQILFKQGIWFEDVEFLYRLLPFVNSIGVVNEPFYRYLIREGSITATNDMRIYDYLDNMNGIVDFYKKKRLYEEYRNQIEYVYVRYIFATFIKSATKFDKKEFKVAVKRAMQNVQTQFPNYRKNIYMQKFSGKNMYLKNFSYTIAKLIYQKYHR